MKLQTFEDLYLSLMVDGGIYEFEPLSDQNPINNKIRLKEEAVWNG
jgi:hypothetical protein